VVSRMHRPQLTTGKGIYQYYNRLCVQRPDWEGGKSRPHRESITERPTVSSVAITTELPAHIGLVSCNIIWDCNT